MGKSDVNGVFKQSFFPFEYLFQVNGKCLPTDLNNWFGSWWSDIWDNFIFDHSNIPMAMFPLPEYGVKTIKLQLMA